MRQARFFHIWKGIIFVALGAVGLLAGCAKAPEAQGPQGATALAGPVITPAYDGLKKRLAVVRFENKVMTPLPDASWQIGDGLAEMLTSELFKTGRFIMVERSALADIVREQEMGQTGLVRKETVTKVGELLGAQLLVAGAVTTFEAGASGGGAGLGIAGYSVALKNRNAQVGVDIRLVDAATGQILKSFNADGKAKSLGVGFAGNVQGITFGSDAFFKTPLGQATREAMAKAVHFISGEMEQVLWSGRVVQIQDGKVYVNAGTNTNLKPGATLAAYAKGADLIDPSTGLNLGSKDTLLGTVTIMEVEERFSIGTFIGNGELKRGDLVKFQYSMGGVR
jgi:curli biogenesis system outer membrane secretion channel CsgG